jgi:cell division protein FtsI/penicillin-binding protein 2
MNRELITSRIRILLSLFFLLIVFLFSRLVYLQIIHHEEFVTAAQAQYESPFVSDFNRGDIYFQTKTGEELPAALKITGYTLAISPRDIKDSAATLTGLLSVLPMLDKNDFAIKVSKERDPYEELVKKLTLDQKKKIESLKLKGVHLDPEYYRTYPYKTTASQILGFVGFDKNNTLSGRYGIERYYNDVLSREPGGVYTNFFAEIFSDLSSSLFEKKEGSRGDVVLTIEPNVQNFVEDELVLLKEKWGGDLVGMIVMDPQTGKIIAMGANPTFDPNNLKNYKVQDFSNPLVENVYEMGSIIKPLTVAAGLDKGVITRHSTYYDSGDLLINGRHVRNYDGRARGLVGVQEVLSQSLNVGTIHIARLLGGEAFKNYMLSFGLAEETGIDLPNEATSLTSNLRSSIEVDYLTTAFGQGMAISPVQTTRALASLGNGGKLVTPYVVDKILYKTGDIKQIVQNDPKQVISQEASEEVTRMLVTVVDTALKGGKYKLEGYSIAAKTGTAQIAKPRGGYYDDKYLHSFFGYFPAYDPRFIVFIFHVDPKGAKYASDTLTDTFFDTAKFLLSYYEIPPDREKAE